MPRNLKRASERRLLEKKVQRHSPIYAKAPKKSERLRQIQGEIDFVHSLPTFFTATWNSTTSRAWGQAVTPVKQCHFFRLPPELRTIVYEFVLTKPYSINLRRRERMSLGPFQGQECTKELPLSVGPSLLRVSSNIRCEAMPVYLCSNTFILQPPMNCFGLAISWLEALITQYGRSPFRDLRFRFSRFPWEEFPKAERLVHLLASGKLELDTNGIDLTIPVREAGVDQRDRLIIMKDVSGGVYVQRALEEAMILAITAREQEWSERKLSFHFRVLVALKMPRKQLFAYKQAENVREKKRLKRERRARRGVSSMDGA